MAIHLNARLDTRFIPMLFSAAFLLSIAASVAHASGSGQLQVPATEQSRRAHQLMRAELESLVREAHPSEASAERVDRRPGLSPITYAPEPAESPRSVIARRLFTFMKREKPSSPGGIGSSDAQALGEGGQEREDQR